ncbi:MAG: hypothetical protein GIW97_02010 [Candidatus Eremiobacteraeota bacterium]|nr:hypothetical protein [Candidatus Eremiobacteraeota bacterium]
MKRLAGVLTLAALLALQGTAMASAPSDRTLSDLRTLIADRVIDGYPADAFNDKKSLSRNEMALLTARAVAKVEASGASAADEARVQALSAEFRPELDALGVRESDLSKLRASLEARTRKTQHAALAGELLAGSSLGFEPSLTLSLPSAGAVTGLAARIGALQAAPGGVAGLALNSRAPLQPVQNGVSISGTAGGVSDFYFSVARVEANALYASPANIVAGSSFTSASFRVTPEQGGYIQFGQHEVLTGRLVHHLRFAPGATIGVTYNHLFDSSQSVAVSGLVSNTVFGMDVAVPVFARSRWHSSFYAEAASSASSNRYVPGAAPALLFTSQPQIDNALVAGIRFKVRSVAATIQYQAVGPNFAAGVQSAAGFFGDVATPATGPSVVVSAPAFTPFDGASAGSAAYVPNSQGVKVSLSTPVRLGAYTVQGNFGAAHLQELAANAYTVNPAVRGTQDSLSAGASFDLRALGRPVSLDLSASLEQLHRNDSTALTYLPYNGNAQGPDPGQFATAPAALGQTYNPNFVNITRRSLNAAAAMPLGHDLRLSLQYNTQYYTGSYSSLNQNIDGRKDFYLGNLTYTIPHTASAITFSAKQYRYRDAFVPNYNLTQNRADLNFTVKF